MAGTTLLRGEGNSPPHRRTVDVKLVYWALMLPAVVLMLGFYIGPLMRILWISVSEPALGFGNYSLLLESAGIQRMLWMTARICLIVTALSLVLGYLVAYVLTHVSRRQRQWMLFCILVPFWLSALIRAFAWIAILNREGMVNTGLASLGLISQPLSLVRNELGVIIGMVHFLLPFAILPMWANMRGIDPAYVKAARGLGASPWSAFWRIFLPTSVPGIFAALVLVTVLSIGFYVTPAILGGGRIVMISEYIGFAIQETLRWGVGTMLASILLLTIFVLLLVASRFVDIRELFGAK